MEKYIVVLLTLQCVAYPYTNDNNINRYSLDIEVFPKQTCTCVPYYQCDDETGTLLTDGVGLLDFRKYQPTPCHGYFDVCCNVTKHNFETTTEDNSEENTDGCGFHRPGMFPWAAALLHQNSIEENPSYKCGVSMIHPKALITAAHCLDDDGLYWVRVGNSMREVSKKIIHPKYSIANLQNDIALLILAEPVELSDRTSIICIPPRGIAFEQKRCIATVLNNTSESPKLTMIKLPLVPRDKCIKLLRTTRLGPFFQLHKSFICAGGNPNEDTCGGDGGNPLICPVPGQPKRYHQAGIVSWGIGCGESNIPGIYVRLSLFREWIDRHMIENNLGITTYRY